MPHETFDSNDGTIGSFNVKMSLAKQIWTSGNRMSKVRRWQAKSLIKTLGEIGRAGKTYFESNISDVPCCRLISLSAFFNLISTNEFVG